jgi:hypothetical protein
MFDDRAVPVADVQEMDLKCHADPRLTMLQLPRESIHLASDTEP